VSLLNWIGLATDGSIASFTASINHL